MHVKFHLLPDPSTKKLLKIALTTLRLPPYASLPNTI